MSEYGPAAFRTPDLLLNERVCSDHRATACAPMGSSRIAAGPWSAASAARCAAWAVCPAAVPLQVAVDGLLVAAIKRRRLLHQRRRCLQVLDRVTHDRFDQLGARRQVLEDTGHLTGGQHPGVGVALNKAGLQQHRRIGRHHHL
jgi:hypothetical protein